METQNKTQKPRSISLAVNILWASWALGLFKTILDLFSHDGNSPAMFTTSSIVGLVLAFALYLLIIIKISAGRNWARIVFLVFVIIGTLSALTMLGFFLLSPIIGALYLAQLGLQAFVLFLVFTKPGSLWFREKVVA